MSFAASYFRPIALCMPLACLGCQTSQKVEAPSATTRPANVTPRATLIATQSGDALFTLQSTGVFSVIDSASNQCIFATPVMSDQRVFFSPHRKQIYLNNAVVYQGPLDPSRQYRFYFEKE